ncbi:MAG: addiction module protein [Planctomycetaceae bacterium]|nr:addiction module protein [Planctomycetaceae bacterium]
MAVDFAELRRLSPEQKLQIVTMLWEDLRESPSVLKLSQDDLDEINRREEYMKEHPDEWLTSDQMWARVDELVQARADELQKK